MSMKYELEIPWTADIVVDGVICFQNDCIVVIEWDHDGPDIDWEIVAFRFEDKGKKVTIRHNFMGTPIALFGMIKRDMDMEKLEERFYDYLPREPDMEPRDEPMSWSR